MTNYYPLKLPQIEKDPKIIELFTSKFFEPRLDFNQKVSFVSFIKENVAALPLNVVELDINFFILPYLTFFLVTLEYKIILNHNVSEVISLKLNIEQTVQNLILITLREKADNSLTLCFLFIKQSDMIFKQSQSRLKGG